jgi:hypothetical protein
MEHVPEWMRPTFASPLMEVDAASIVSRIRAVFVAPPKQVPTEAMSDGPLLGNGEWKIRVGRPPADSMFSQSEEIIRAVRNITDGLPQLVYLVGWQ